jgi:S-adenosylmethionine:tRNA-ribosyltransferase-isomerase (queuine synthetase)
VNLLAFELPAALEAHEPPEARGLARDGVRLMVARSEDGSITHAGFRQLPELLEPGDLVVVNRSATLPAALDGWREDGRRARVHVSTRAPRLDRRYRVIELRASGGTRQERGQAGEQITLAGGATLQVVAPYASGARLLLGRFDLIEPVEDYLGRHGQPIRYGHLTRSWPLEAYQNVYAQVPGSAEMPSAGRPFTPELLTALIARGILVATITLHAGVSSPERHEPPFPEQFEVPEPTARMVEAVHGWGGRVIAVGTTVVRALESATTPEGRVQERSGWTALVITPERGVQTVDGLITGWHEPEASHLQMLEAIAGPELLAVSYDAALDEGYLWHEFGDSHLIIADRGVSP